MKQGRAGGTTADSVDPSSPLPPTSRRRCDSIAAPTAAVRFATEIVVLVALATWSLQTPYVAVVRWLLALATAGVAAAVWGRFVAPRSSTRLADPARLATEVVVFTAAGAALATLGGPALGLGFLVIAVGAAVLVRCTERRGDIESV